MDPFLLEALLNGILLGGVFALPVLGLLYWPALAVAILAMRLRYGGNAESSADAAN